jgi:hypothetical protein
VNVALLKLGVDPERLVVALQSAPYEHFAERRSLSDLASTKRAMLVPENALVLPSIQTSAMTASFRRAAVLASGSKPVGPEDM